MSDKTSSSGPVSGVANRFASALLETADESGPGAIDQVERDLDRFNALIAESPDLARLVRSPVFSSEQQLGAIKAILDKAGIGGLAANFLKLVASKRRLFAVQQMISAYKAMVATKRGLVHAEVTVAEAPSPRVVDDIKAALKGVAGDKVVLDVKVDPSIIGGLIVKLGSRMMDASLRTKLNSIRLAMKEVG
ncbi:F0F1 ATP synthase subunit delta [Chelatococcus reniformis]|uniref:ATP synthase subunit delta n=1 Tax=Chelatococcus reniformis TaxID=1494448 RepID=A0A916X894_9HYPH|nr:F0F1 ATP synthase subunit delta [Chelatococcus reniformis]GGC51108.1 ATP synthase subunit delta [Chelatococcus reniformis]